MKTFKPILLSIAVTVLSATAYIFIRPFRQKHEGRKVNKSSDVGRSSEASQGQTLYRTPGIKRLELKDVPAGISPLTINDCFTGEAMVVPGEQDKYSVQVVDDEGHFVGRIGKNRRLSNSLSAWHGGRIFIFGKMDRNGDDQVPGITVFIPAGLDDDQIARLSDVFEKLRKRRDILNTPVISSQEYLEVLDDHKFISSVILELDIVDEVDVSLSKRIIPALSKQLEEEEDWDGLIKLEQHSDLIDELSERFAGTTYRRISKAKKTKGVKK